MLSRVIIDSIDMFKIIFLWTVLTNEDNNIFKLLSSVVITSILIIAIEQLGLNFIATYIMIIMTIKIIYKKDLKDVIFQFLLVILIEMSLESIFSLITIKFVYNYTLIAIITELITLVCIIIFSKIKLSRKIRVEKINGSILFYFILTCSVYAIVFKIIWNYDNTIILNNLFITSVILSVLVISQILAYVYVVKIIKEKEILKVSSEYNKVIDEIVQEIKQRQHDFVNYKNTIKGMIEVVEEKDVKAAINNYIKAEDMYDNKINELIYIDNVVIRSIMYRNICRAKEHNVNFQYKIENDVLDNIFSYHEISNLLNNLINNAFDEVIKDECIKKDIEIKILNENKIPHLIIKNQIVSANDINLNEMFTRGYSTKSNGTRGYGLYNVQQIVHLHKGYIKINIERGEIIFNIYFNDSSR